MAVGLAQATAILPGISRSGVTIAAGLSSGLAREDAARFSFMLSAPTILAAGVVQAASRAGGPLLPGEFTTLAIGFGMAFVVGYLAIAWLIRYLSRAPLYAFAVYTWVLGLATLWLLR
jgi:undecaprenyl-diphosphatase